MFNEIYFYSEKLYVKPREKLFDFGHLNQHIYIIMEGVIETVLYDGGKNE